LKNSFINFFTNYYSLQDSVKKRSHQEKRPRKGTGSGRIDWLVSGGILGKKKCKTRFDVKIGKVNNWQTATIALDKALPKIKAFVGSLLAPTVPNLHNRTNK